MNFASLSAAFVPVVLMEPTVFSSTNYDKKTLLRRSKFYRILPKFSERHKKCSATPRSCCFRCADAQPMGISGNPLSLEVVCQISTQEYAAFPILLDFTAATKFKDRANGALFAMVGRSKFGWPCFFMPFSLRRHAPAHPPARPFISPSNEMRTFPQRCSAVIFLTPNFRSKSKTTAALLRPRSRKID